MDALVSAVDDAGKQNWTVLFEAGRPNDEWGIDAGGLDADLIRPVAEWAECFVAVYCLRKPLEAVADNAYAEDDDEATVVIGASPNIVRLVGKWAPGAWDLEGTPFIDHISKALGGARLGTGMS
jgi:hypothetical protein